VRWWCFVIQRNAAMQRENACGLALAEVESLKGAIEMENAYLQEEIRAEHNYSRSSAACEPIKHCIRQIRPGRPDRAPVLDSVCISMLPARS